MDGARASRLGLLLVAIGLATACDGGQPPASPAPTVSATPPADASRDVRHLEVTASTCLNIRARPSLQAAVIGCAPTGTVLTHEGRSREADGRRWLRVGGAWEGWAAAEFLRRTDKEPTEQG